MEIWSFFGRSRSHFRSLLYSMLLLLLFTHHAMSSSIIADSSTATTTAATTTATTATTATTEGSTMDDTTTVVPTEDTTTYVTTAVPIPESPVNVTVTAVNTTAVNVSWVWEPYSNNDNLIVTFDISLKDQQGYSQEVFGVDTTSILIGELTGGTEYDASVEACTNATVQCSTPANGAGFTVPEVPRDLSARPQSMWNLTIVWTLDGRAQSYLLSLNGGEFTNFTTYTCTGASPEQTCSGTVTNLPIAGGLYYLRLVALAGGYSSDSGNTTGVTDPPSAGSVSCIAATNSSLEVKIYSPDYPPNDYNISSYTVVYTAITNGSNPVSNISAAFNGNSTVGDLTDLISGYTYYLSVTSLSYNTPSSSVVSTNCTTALNPPALKNAIAFDTQINVSWSAPSQGFYELYEGKCSMVSSAGANLNFSVPPSQTKAVCEPVVPGALYNVSVATALNGSSLTAPSQTMQTIAIPLSPQSVSAATGNDSSIVVTITYPQSAILCTTYTVSALSSQNIQSTQIPCDPSETKVTVGPLQSDSSFNVSVIANKTYGSLTEESLPTSLQNVVWTTPSAVGTFDDISKTTTSITVQWTPPTDHANVNCYLLTILPASMCNQNIIVLCSEKNNSSCSSLSADGVSCPSKPNATMNCNSASLSYQIKDLTTSTNYTLNVYAENAGGRGPPTPLRVSTEAGGGSNAWIAGVVIGVLVLVVIAALIAYYVWKQRRSGKPRPPRRPPSTCSDTSEISRPRPVHVNEFSEHVQKLHRDADYLFSAEFELLAKLSPRHPNTASELPVNRVKNRFVNILPFDHSRVKLIPVDDDEAEGSDYINASFMPGYNSRREFIAAQGPMRCTVDDFWRMIWEQNVHIIVVVTNLQERGREKCVQYWPNDKESVFHGEVQINMISESSLNFYVLRNFEIRVGNKGRRVQQYHYLNMMDFMAPENAEEFLGFLQIVQTAQAQNARYEHPTIVHCSAGVGRTGTYIVIDHLLKLIKKEEMIDIFSIILDMRDHRCSMIQSEAQYIFVHECLQLAIELGLHKNGPAVNNGFIADESLIDIGMGPEAIYMNTVEVQQPPRAYPPPPPVRRDLY